jgi:preflagellin peptidase FlaK
MYVTATAFIITFMVLISASIQDRRSREVSDIHWVVICATGIAMMFFAAISEISAARVMICIGSVMIAVNILHDAERPLFHELSFNTVALLMFLVPAITAYGDPFVRDSMVIPISYMIFVIMFFTGAIKGGADVKCLISLAIAFPMYPIMFGYPLIGVPGYPITMLMSFPLAVLLCASLFSISAMIPIIIRNLIRKDTRMPNMLFGYTMNGCDVKDSHVWVMKNCEDTNDERIWVTPKIPFIIPITAAFVFVALVGNLIFLI